MGHPNVHEMSQDNFEDPAFMGGNGVDEWVEKNDKMLPAVNNNNNTLMNNVNRNRNVQYSGGFMSQAMGMPHSSNVNHIKGMNKYYRDNYQPNQRHFSNHTNPEVHPVHVNNTNFINQNNPRVNAPGVRLNAPVNVRPNFQNNQTFQNNNNNNRGSQPPGYPSRPPVVHATAPMNVTPAHEQNRQVMKKIFGNANPAFNSHEASNVQRVDYI